MLVLSRKPGEKIVIDGNITLTVVSCEGGRIRIGIDAPREVSILRGELLDPLECHEDIGAGSARTSGTRGCLVASGS